MEKFNNIGYLVKCLLKFIELYSIDYDGIKVIDKSKLEDFINSFMEGIRNDY